MVAPEKSFDRRLSSMNNSRFTFLAVAVLIVLLGLLAFLQYRWLGQISDGERERLSRTVKADTGRFAEDFDNEIQSGYFNFQMNADDWRARNWKEFNERYDFFVEQAAYPDLVKNFYFIELAETPLLLKYEKKARTFQTAEWNEQLIQLRQKIESADLSVVDAAFLALAMPIYEMSESVTRVVVRTDKTENFFGSAQKKPKKYGIFIIELNRNVIANEILPDLTKKYFSVNESAEYNVAVVNENNQTVFQTAEVGEADADARLFTLSPEKFMFFFNRDNFLTSNNETAKKVVVSRIDSTQNSSDNSDAEKKEKIDVQVFSRQAANEKPSEKIFVNQNFAAKGLWTLNVQHSAGSLEQFINNTRRNNLAVSFGILLLLAVSVILIFVSAHRAKVLARRQMDFVSGVSHEFRTPLAVIYSAGENLSDGIVRDERRVAGYGDLIKREGKKLAGMIEQILGFAGAEAGKRQYNFDAFDANEIIEKALSECRSLIEEKQFSVELAIEDNLPKIRADESSLSQALRNLIANSLKYGNGARWLKISAENGGNRVKIIVEDRGIGIDKSDLKKIFEPFYRSKEVIDAQIHGNGLGLSLVKQTIGAHGGKVYVESEVGIGSRFTIELPAALKNK